MRKKFILLIAGVTLLANPAYAANTIQEFNADFPSIGGAGPPLRASTVDVEIIDGWSGHALQLTPELNSLNQGAAFNPVVAGGYDELRFDFEMSFSPGNGGGADGIGFAYANVARFPNNGRIPPSFSEEPNLTDSFGVGFDTFNNADVGLEDGGENSVSLHWNGARIDSFPIDGETLSSLETGNVIQASIVIKPSAADSGSKVSVKLTDKDTNDIVEPYKDFLVPGFLPYDGRMAFRARTGGANSQQVIDNITLTHDPVAPGAPFVYTEKFEGYAIGPAPIGSASVPATLVGGTPYASTQNGSVPGPQLVPDSDRAGIGPGHLQLTDEIGSQHNFVAFDKTSNNASKITANFDFRLLNNDGTFADGMAFVLASTGDYGDSGELVEGAAPWNPAEEPNLAGALGIGFDTFNNDGIVGSEEGGDCPADTPTFCEEPGNTTRRSNHVSLHWDGQPVAEFKIFPQDELDLVGDEFHSMTVTYEEVQGGAMVSVSIVDGTDGSTHVAFDNVMIPDAKFNGGARAAFGARTGGAQDAQAIDNLNISFGDAGIPGDFDNDGDLDAADINLLTAAVRTGNNPAPFDLNADNQVNGSDRTIWVNNLKKTYFGDANLDREFNSGDFVAVFTVGKYETGANALWQEGDWDGNGKFDSGDFVAAFTEGGYEKGPHPAVNGVPEPSALVLFALGLVGLIRHRRKR